MLNSVIPLNRLKKDTLYKIVTKDPYPAKAKTTDTTLMFRCRVHPYHQPSASPVTVYLPTELVDNAFDAAYFVFRGIKNIKFVNVLTGEPADWQVDSRQWWERPPRSNEHVTVCSHRCPRRSAKRFCSACGDKKHQQQERCSGDQSPHMIFCIRCGGLKSSCSSCGDGVKCKQISSYRYLLRIHRQDLRTYAHATSDKTHLPIPTTAIVASHSSMIHWVLEHCPFTNQITHFHHQCTEFTPDCVYCFIFCEHR